MSQVPGHWITPPEVEQFARELRAAADQIREVFHTATAVRSQLDSSWFGNAKNIFDSHFDGFPHDVASFAHRLDQMASEALAIQVWVPDES